MSRSSSYSTTRLRSRPRIAVRPNRSRGVPRSRLSVGERCQYTELNQATNVLRIRCDDVDG
jgi:hypothetical protein